ncbi:MAG: alpha/beta fold hydrolase [Anaerolineaceae bacterium]
MKLQQIAYEKDNLLSYAEYGSPTGFPILIQHGIIASIKGAAIFQQLLDMGTRLICIARPGYGESSPYEMKNIGAWGRIVSVLIDELRLSQFDIFGISSGAPYAYAIGYACPEKTRNIFILSGIPALYDEKVLSFWPYGVKKDAAQTEMQTLARQIFFSSLSPEDLENDDIQDSMMNNCFGVAQDLRIRCMDWGFKLSDVQSPVILRHSRADESVPFAAAEITAQLLPRCRLDIRENDGHFSQAIVDNFIKTSMAECYRKG